MQWTRIKTLFIFSFLILNIFLLVQLMNKQQDSDLGVMENEDTTIEQHLSDENINITANLDQEKLEENYIAVRQKNFDEADKSALKNLKDQSFTIINDSLIVSMLEDDVKVPDKATNEEITASTANLFLNSEQYTFWNWNKDYNVLLFFQKKNDRPVYYNQSGIVMLFLNEDNEIVYYTQTMLGEAEKSGDKKQLTSSASAIAELYKANELKTDDTITKVDIGFHTMVPLENGIQSFAPSWKITVNDDKHFFINAIEGRILFSDEHDFMEKTMSALHDKTKESTIDSEEKEEILTLFEKNMKEAE